MPKTLYDALHAAGAKFFDWMPDGLGPHGIREDEILARFVLSFATPDDDIDNFVELIRLKEAA
jgi:hypothetical protein